jgi:hypothetical protein
MAMPWSKAKEKQRKIEADANERTRLCDLFNQCFRIQREVSAAAGHYVPMIVENVRGAQKWVGKARWNFGSFYLWGDVPALMPIPARSQSKVGGTSISNVGFNVACVRKLAHGDPNITMEEGRKHGGDCFNDPSWPGKQGGQKSIPDSCKRLPGARGGKISGYPHIEGSKGFKDFHDSPIAALGSKSSARKKASAEIAKIPKPLAQWIAKTFKPK